MKDNISGKDWLDCANNPGPDAIVPFSSGSSAMMWDDRNCGKCRRSIATRKPDEATGEDYKYFEKAVLEGQECGAKLCLDTSMVSGFLHPMAAMWMGGTNKGVPNRCKHIVTKHNWEPPPYVEPVHPNQTFIPFQEHWPLIALDGLVITGLGIFEEADLKLKP